MKKTIDDCFFQIQNGANIKQGDVDGGFPITRIETTANDKFNRDRMGYAGITDISKYESYVLEDGDLLMSHINSVQYLGRTVLYVKQTDETIIHGMNLLRLKARRDVINPAYARYCFYGNPFRRQVRKITKKSVNQASFAVKDLKQIKIDVPSLLEQEQIVEVLDKLQKIIEIRSNELSTLDELIKARFVEMFGDCGNMVSLNDLCLIITDGTHQPPKFQETGIPFILVSNLSNNTVTYNTVKYVSEETYDELYKRTPIELGDLLLSTVGSYGHPAVVTEDIRFLFQRHIAYLKPKRELVNSFYLHSALLASDGQRQIEEKVKGIAQKTLNLSEIRKIMIPFPKLEEQNAFAAFVHHVDKSKVAVQKSLDETKLLFDSLMQQYFG
ncbi:restriction endonuclease subunit S [Firmicutes bacterium OM07-11]|nr:restriction endonuclease subunit S [Firmicutes bacterium OM07-11]